MCLILQSTNYYCFNCISILTSNGSPLAFIYQWLWTLHLNFRQFTKVPFRSLFVDCWQRHANLNFNFNRFVKWYCYEFLRKCRVRDSRMWETLVCVGKQHHARRNLRSTKTTLTPNSWRCRCRLSKDAVWRLAEDVLPLLPRKRRSDGIDGM